MATNKKYEAVIIGAGIGGFTAAIRISQLGGKACIIEEKALGGVCSNTGCIPAKAMVASAKLISDIEKGKRLGVITESVKPDFNQLRAHVNSSILKSVKGVEALLKSHNIEVIKGYGSILAKDKVTVYENKKKERIIKEFYAENIIIATGSVPSRPGIFKTNQNIVTSDEVFSLEKIPESVTIVGGGYIGLEFSCVFKALGSKVTIVEKMDQLINTEEEEISKEIEKILNKKGIEIFKECEVKGLSEENGKIALKASQKAREVEFKSDKILISVGRKPILNQEEINALDITVEKGAIKSGPDMRTNIKNIYAIGDINGKYMLAHTAAHEGIIAAENIMGLKTKMDYNKVPSVIFTTPEIASVGKKEGKVGRFPFIANGKAFTSRDTEGFVKTYFDKGRLVGASIIGPSASSLISIVQSLIGSDIDKIRKIIPAHPSFPEAVFDSMLASGGEAITLPKKDDRT